MQHIVTTPDYELEQDFPFEISECSNCGFIFTSTRPDFETLFSKFYPDEYICYGAKSGIAGLMDQKRMTSQATQRSRFVQSVMETTQAVRLMEVGCATGEFLKTCREDLGWEVTGIEPNEGLAGQLRKEGFEVYAQPLENVELQEKHYHAICLFNVFEHLWDPVLALKKINTALVDGGCIVLEIPNFDSLGRSLFGKYWFLYHLPRHLSHFSHDSLDGLMKASGFSRHSIAKQFRPTVNVLSFQYFIQEYIRNNGIRTFFSEKNPFMIAIGVFYELLQNAVAQSNIMMAVYCKEHHLQGPHETLVQERRI